MKFILGLLFFVLLGILFFTDTLHFWPTFGLGFFFLVVLLIAGSASDAKAPAKSSKAFISFPSAAPDLPPVELVNMNRGVLIVAGPGAGKSESLIKPIIHKAVSYGWPGILYDWKYPELAAVAYAAHRQNPDKAMQFYCVNLADPNQSHRLNPLADIPTNAYAREYATTIIKNLMPETIHKPDFFARAATAILAATIWYLHEEHPMFCTIPHVVSLILVAPPKTLIEQLGRNPEVADMLSAARSGLDSERQTASVFSTLKDALSVFSNREIFWVLSGNDFDLDLNNPDNPKFMCLANQQDISEVLSPLLSMIISATIKHMNQPGKKQSIVLLDEAPTLYVPNFDRLPATARSNKVAAVVAMQDLSQLFSMYGAERGESILANLSNQFWGRTTNVSTAERVVKMFGREDTMYQSYSSTKSKMSGSMRGNTSRGTSESFQERDRVRMQWMKDIGLGMFFTQTVEAAQNEHIPAAIRMAKLPEPCMPDFPAVSPEQLKENFQSIRADAESVINA